MNGGDLRLSSRSRAERTTTATRRGGAEDARRWAATGGPAGPGPAAWAALGGARILDGPVTERAMRLCSGKVRTEGVGGF